jgi:hypothetical protein
MGNTSSLSTKSLAKSYQSGVSAYRLAKDNGCSIWAVITRLRKAGVEIRPDGTPKSLRMTPIQKQVFDSLNAGLLLGDASINGNSTTRREKCFLRMGQSDRRLGWLEQVCNVYAGLGVHVNIIPVKLKVKLAFIEGRKIKTGPASLLYTGVSDEFRELRRIWYPKDGPKRIPKNLRLDPLSVAMWFCGDGSASGSTNGQLGFYTNGFSKRDVQFLSKRLKTDVDIETIVRPSHRDGEWTIWTNGRDSSVRLNQLIKPHMPECCLYKLRYVRPPKKAMQHRALNHKQALRLLKRRNEGASYSTLAKEFEVSVSIVANIVTGKTYAEISRR